MVSKTNSTALILGETGTGKDVIAQAIHKNSQRKGPSLLSTVPLYPLNSLNQNFLVMKRVLLQGQTN